MVVKIDCGNHSRGDYSFVSLISTVEGYRKALRTMGWAQSLLGTLVSINP